MKLAPQMVQVHNKSALWLKPIVLDWFQLMDEYRARVKWKRTALAKRLNWNLEDCPWWYTERANTGLLAAAAIRRNHLALEEFNDTKYWRGGGYQGRVDLMIWRKGKPKPFAFEAKQAFIDIAFEKDEMQWTWTKRTQRRIKHALRGATRNAKSLGKDYSRYGMAFSPVCMRESASGQALDQSLKWAALNIRSVGQGIWLSAYYSPRLKGRAMEKEQPRWHSRHHIGIVLVIWPCK